MPSRDQIDSVLAEIESLQSERPKSKPWAALPPSEQSAALEEIEWAGFSRREEMAVIGRIVAGEPPELWMEGVNDKGDARDGWMDQLSIDGDSRQKLAAELDRIKNDTYVELEEQVAGWNYTRGEDGMPFHELPVTDREVLVEDYVDWHKYMERGLTFEDQARVMHEAARDPFPRGTAEIREEPAALPTPEEFSRLGAEWTHDSGLRYLEERGVRYEDAECPDPSSGYREALKTAARRATDQPREKSRGPER